MALTGAVIRAELSSPAFATAPRGSATEPARGIPAERLPDAVLSGWIVIDVRTQRERDAEGTLPGALAIDRTLVGRRLDPSGPERLSRAADTAAGWVLVCSDGRRAAELAGRLRSRGLARVTAVTDGYVGLRAARMVGAIAQAEHLRREAATISAH